MAKRIVYDWVIEVVEGSVLESLTADLDIVESYQYQTAGAMLQHLGELGFASEHKHTRPALVRDVLDHFGSVLCRSWAYLHKTETGYGLPDDFLDAMGEAVAAVPDYQRKALAQALANI